MPEGSDRVRARRVFWTVLAGALLLELAWVLALPAFRGADEFDHAYKADAVAHGQLRGTVAATDGRGQLLAVEPALVEAAGPVCSSYAYTGPDNCSPAGSDASGRAWVASGAASYNPVFYAVAGTVARPFEGVAALFAMRLATATMTALLLATAAAVTARWARTGWPLLGLALGCTPVLVQSGGVAAPNAVGYAAACVGWAAALGLVRRPRSAGWATPLALAGAVVLVTHSTGLLWWGCLVAVVGLLAPVSTWRRLLVHDRPFGAAVAVVAVTACACVAWILAAGTNRLGPADVAAAPMVAGDLLRMQVLWGFQTVAAFPLRTQMAPVGVYVAWWSALLVVGVWGLLVARRQVRIAAAVLLLLWIVVPLGLTVVSYTSEGYAWQGRYALPLALGLPALCCLALDERATRVPRAAGVGILGLLAAAHLASVVAVSVSERRGGLPGTVLSAPWGPVLVGVVAAVGLLLLARTTASGARGPRPELPSPARRLVEVRR